MAPRTLAPGADSPEYERVPICSGIAVRTYREILTDADRHFASVAADQEQNLACRLGCTMCCHGYFEIGAADVAVIAEAIGRLEPAERRRLVKTAQRAMDETGHPDLREASTEEREAFFARTERLPCPALSPSGACSIYDSRPLVCRTFGLPLREGPRFIGEECELNFTAATREQRERAAWDLMQEDVLGPEDQFTVAEAIVLADRVR